MITTLTSDSNDLVSLFANDEHHRTSRFPVCVDNGVTARSEAMSLTSIELSDDSSLTTDDLVVLSDLFGFSSSTANPERATGTTTRPRSRKRPRRTKAETDDVTLPKSQQQRQKMEIEGLKRQVVEMQATIEQLHARKLERERRAVETFLKQEEIRDSTKEWGNSHRQVTAVQQLEEQNEKLRTQVTTHIGQLKQIEQIARARYLANAVPEQRQLAGPDFSNYYSESC